MIMVFGVEPAVNSGTIFGQNESLPWAEYTFSILEYI